MYKIIGGDQKEYGPVSADQLRQWIAEGRANGQTQILIDERGQWQALAELPEFAAELQAQAQAHPQAAAALPMSPDEYLAAITPRDYQVGIIRCIGRGFTLLQNHLGLLVGSNLAIGVIMFVLLVAGGGVDFLLKSAGAFPCAQITLQLILAGPLSAGVYFLCLKLIRNEPAELKDAFAGFTRFAPLMQASVFIGALNLVPGHYFEVEFTKLLQAIQAKGSLASVNWYVFWGAVLAMFLIWAVWFFTFVLIIDKQLGCWQAMELCRRKVFQHFGKMLLLFLVASQLFTAGLLLCCVGIIFTAPLFVATMMYAYEDIFRPTAETAD